MSRITLQDRLSTHPRPRAPAPSATPPAERDFSSWDALGLARNFQVLNALGDACAREGLHSVPLHAQHQALEQAVCSWLQFPAARSFQNLGQARLALQLAVLTDEQDLVLHDHHNVPGLIDPTRLIGCRMRHFPHQDASGAAWQLRQAPRGLAAIISEALFTRDGQLAPLRELAAIATAHQATLLVDDTWGIGTCGVEGRGALALTGVGAQDIGGLVISLEHALGLQGAVVLGSPDLIARIDAIAEERGLPRPAPAIAQAAVVAVQLAQRDHWRRERLEQLNHHLHQHLRGHGLALRACPPSSLHVINVAGDPAQWQLALSRRGLHVPVQAQVSGDGQVTSRLRIHLSNVHTPALVVTLAETITLINDAIQLQVPLVPHDAT